MKKLVSINLLAILLIACGGNEKEKSTEEIIATQNLEQIKKQKDKLIAKQNELIVEISEIQKAINDLDTSKSYALVTTMKVEETVFEHHIDLQGNVQTKENIIIFPEFSGLLTKIYITEGQYVKKGQLLASIDDGGLSNQLAQMEINLALAKTTFERQQRLWNQKIGSEIQFLQTKTNYEAQENAVKQMEQQIAKSKITAPFSGTIDEIITEQGQVVGAGQSQLFRIVNLNRMHIETDVPESYLNQIKKGTNVKVSFPVLGESTTTKVSQASSFINPSNRTFRIEIPVSNSIKNVKPNLTAKLEINDYTNSKCILIPQSLISENASGQQYVYTVVDKTENMAKTKKTIIATGKTQGDVIEVLSGLNNGVEIISEGARSVKDNQTVEIIN